MGWFLACGGFPSFSSFSRSPFPLSSASPSVLLFLSYSSSPFSFLSLSSPLPFPVFLLLAGSSSPSCFLSFPSPACWDACRLTVGSGPPVLFLPPYHYGYPSGISAFNHLYPHGYLKITISYYLGKDGRWTTGMLDWQPVGGFRAPGRPMARWEDVLVSFMQGRRRWSEVAQDRDRWSALEDEFSRGAVDLLAA